MTADWEHPVRKSMREGRPVIGVTITVPNADVAAHAAAMGFDFLWIEMEHSPITLESLRNIVLATRGLNTPLLARVPVNEIWQAKRVLDQGVSGVIFPFTGTGDLARQAVAACKYPPAGRRGSGAGLATHCWPLGEGYYDFADKHFLVVAVVEEARAVDSIDEIAATPGIDVIFIGTSDLSFSLGLRGRQNESRLDDAINRVIEAGNKYGRFLGRPAFPHERIGEYVRQGFRFFQADTDLGLMTAGARALLDPLGKKAS